MTRSLSCPISTPLISPELDPSPSTACHNTRLWELDAMRGLMLVVILSNHLNINLGIPTDQPLGFVSAAEGFFMLSAYMAGRIYTQRYVNNGFNMMRQAFMRRALVIYGYHVALLLFMFSVIAWLGLTLAQPGVPGLLKFYFQQPLSAFFSSLALIYKPRFLDVLPVYVIFMLISPWILSYGLRRGWSHILLLSAGLWLAVQFGFSALVYEKFAAIMRISVPYHESGGFQILAWQCVWIFGLWLGATHTLTPPAQRRPFSPILVGSALLIGIIFFIWRHFFVHLHFGGVHPFPLGHAWNDLFTKWDLGPCRLLNFFALVVLAIHFREGLGRHIPRIRWLETLGRASLLVFCVHLIIVLLVHSMASESLLQRNFWQDVILFSASLLVLYGVAWWAEKIKKVDKRAYSQRSFIS